MILAVVAAASRVGDTILPRIGVSFNGVTPILDSESDRVKLVQVGIGLNFEKERSASKNLFGVRSESCRNVILGICPTDSDEVQLDEC